MRFTESTHCKQTVIFVLEKKKFAYKEVLSLFWEGANRRTLTRNFSAKREHCGRGRALQCSSAVGEVKKREKEKSNRWLTAADRCPVIRSCGSSSRAAIRCIPAFYGIDGEARKWKIFLFYFPLIIHLLSPLFFAGRRAIKQFSRRLEFPCVAFYARSYLPSFPFVMHSDSFYLSSNIELSSIIIPLKLSRVFPLMREYIILILDSGNEFLWDLYT